ncbi:protein transport protein bet1 [Cystobasidiomycetes sp. EMM_F5]
MSRRSYLTPAGPPGESTLSKRNALLGTQNTYGNGMSTGTGYDNSVSSPYDISAGGNYANAYASRTPSPFVRPPSSNSYASQRQAEDLEGQNEEELEGLGAKVKLLKDVRAVDQLCNPISRLTQRDRLQ